jgi:Family of unknown function (DUF6152)
MRLRFDRPVAALKRRLDLTGKITMRHSGRIKRLLAVTGLALVMAGAGFSPALAHHSFAMFDRQRDIVIKGTVKELQWTNPHVFVQVMVANDKGVEEEWSIESASPNMLFRQGWSPKALHPGDKISVTINPLRSGGRGGYFVFAELADGKTLGQRPGQRRGGGPPG